MPGPAAAVAGWYGKIPALGDFASRRLPADFLNVWDAWLQDALAASRSALGERWKSVYLNSPIWHFALLPGVCGSSCWAGVLMPSIDKVGRHFPLTIAVPLPPHPEIIATVFAAQDWFAAIEQIALSSLDKDFSVEALETRLTATPFGPCDPLDTPERQAAREWAAWWNGASQAPMMLNLPTPGAIAGVLGASGVNLLLARGCGKSLWWRHDELAGTLPLQGFFRLPPAAHFENLLYGHGTGAKDAVRCQDHRSLCPDH
ncbi:MAG: type VI secretion system-associated protein TagF [Pseudomonadota bacterium]|nr:type VI secretion system-associated protein TagF [Pseudomonadota bacterium]